MNILCVAILTFLTTAALPTKAQAAEEFYRGRQLVVLVGSEAGGGFDLYTRLLAPHFARHIPGNPAIVIQNMPGASGVVAANHLANVAPRDGTVIASLFPGNVVQPLLENNDSLKYDPRTLNWIGNIDSLTLACFMRRESTIKTVAQAKAREVIVGATSRFSSAAILPSVMNNLLGTRFKVTTGYSNSDLLLAFERGEIEGICGNAFSTLQQTRPEWIARGDVTFIAQSGLSRIAPLAQIPLVSELATNPADKATFHLLDMRLALGRPYAAPPGMPADRLATLRQAFALTMADKEYLADAAKAKQDVNYIDHRGMEQVITDAYAMPRNVIDRVIELTRPPAN